jgi:hypothetical protein
VNFVTAFIIFQIRTLGCFFEYYVNMTIVIGGTIMNPTTEAKCCSPVQQAGMPAAVMPMTLTPVFKLAHSYVPYQQLTCIYPPLKGLKCGTIFPELSRPYGTDPEYTVDQ